MMTWQLVLKVRRRACEGRLSFARERHSDITLERNRCPVGGESYKKKSDKMALLRWQIYRELDEIEHIKKLFRVGPIVGNRMALHVKEGGNHRVKPGPTIITLIERVIEQYSSMAEDEWVQTNSEISTEFHARSVGEGADIALQVLSNPYLFLTRDERAAYDAAETDEDKIVSRRAGDVDARGMILPPGQSAPSLAKVKQAQGGGIVTRRKDNA